MRVTCYRCFWPQHLCWCGSITPIGTRTRFVLLMHPKEFKKEKAATGRLIHLCLKESEIHCGIGFDQDAAVQALIDDDANFPVLLYPGREAIDLAAGDPAGFAARVGTRRLVVFLLDATWALARKMLRLSPSLQRLPRIMFTPTAPSRYVIKPQPHAGCLSTLESAHELLLALERSGLDRYARPEQMLDLFQRMQEFQLRCAADPTRGGYRRRAYKTPAERVTNRHTRRERVFQAPVRPLPGG